VGESVWDDPEEAVEERGHVIVAGEGIDPCGRDGVDAVENSGDAAGDASGGIGVFAEIDGAEGGFCERGGIEEAPEGSLEGMDDVAAAVDFVFREGSERGVEEAVEVGKFGWVEGCGGGWEERGGRGKGVGWGGSAEQRADEETEESAGQLGPWVGVGEARGHGEGSRHGFGGIGCAEEGEREDAHERAIAIGVFR